MDGGDSSNRIGEEEATLNEGWCTDEEVVWDPTVKILSSNGLRLSIEIELKSSVENLKKAIARMTGWPVGQQRLIFAGRLMKNDETLESYGIKHYQTVRLVTKPGAGTRLINSTSTEAGSNGERHDLVGQSFFAEYDPNDWPELAKNSMNKPNTPNTDPLPNPWASTGKYGAQRW